MASVRRHKTGLFRLREGKPRQKTCCSQPAVRRQPRQRDRVRRANIPPILKIFIKETDTKNSRTRQQLTTFGMKTRTRFGTWNIRTLLEASRLAQVCREMETYRLDILGLSETRWPDNGEVTTSDGRLFLYSGKQSGDPRTGGVGMILSGNIKKSLIEWQPISDRIIQARFRGQARNVSIVQCYAPTEVAESEDKENFYNQLCGCLRRIGKADLCIVMGDLNAKVGTDNTGLEQIMGRHGTGSRNDNGERLIDVCASFDLVIGGTVFPHREIHKNTWTSPDQRTQNQIDHIMICRKWRRSLLDVKVRRGADMASDHHLVLGVIRVKLAAIKPKFTNKAPRKFQVDNLKRDEIRNSFIQNLNVLSHEEQYAGPGNLNTNWTQLRAAFIGAGEAVVGYRRNSKEEWISHETWDKIDERKKVKTLLAAARSLEERIELSKKHTQLNKIVKRSVRRDKRAWIDGLAAQAQQAAEHNNTKLLYHITKRLSGRGFSGSPPIKAKDGTLLTSKDDQLIRWTEYFKEVYDQVAAPAAEPADDQPVMDEWLPERDVEQRETSTLKIKTGPPSTAEIKTAIKNLKNGKAPGIDEIPPEFFTADTATTAELLQPVIEMAWNQEDLPSEWKKGIIIKLPKKGSRSLCENWRGITLLTSINKIIAFTIFKRLSTILEPHLRGEQAGFRPNRSCVDQINTLRILIEQSQEWNSPLYLVFVDFTRAFDSLKHSFLWKVLMDYGVPNKIIRVIQALYKNASSCVAHGGVLGENILIRAGVKQGCILSPFLFILVVDHILRRLEKTPRGVLWSFSKRLEDLDYADDICLLTHTFRDMQDKLSEFADLAMEAGLCINIRKTKSMRLGTKIRAGFVLGDEKIEEVEEFCYLGSVVSCSGGAETDVANRIKKARQAYSMLRNIWASSLYSANTKLRIFNSNVKSVLLYGCETWKMTTSIIRSLQTFVNRCLRRILCIFWPKTITNSELYTRANQPELEQQIRRRKWNWIGHTLRKPESDINRQSLEWNPQGARNRGRPKQSWRRTVLSEAKGQNYSWNQIKYLASNRIRWRSFVEALCSCSE